MLRSISAKVFYKCYDYFPLSVKKYILRSLLYLDNTLRQTISSYSNSYFGYSPKRQILKINTWFETQIESNDTILDIGCNDGWLTRKIAQKTQCDVYAIDLIPSIGGYNLNYGQSIQENSITFTRISFEDFSTEYIPKNIQTVTMSNVLEHLNDFEHISDFLTHILRNIQSNSLKILIRVPDIDRDWLVQLKALMNVPYFLDDDHKVEFSVTSLLSLFDSLNTDQIKLEKRFGEIYLSLLIFT